MLTLLCYSIYEHLISHNLEEKLIQFNSKTSSLFYAILIVLDLTYPQFFEKNYHFLLLTTLMWPSISMIQLFWILKKWWKYRLLDSWISYSLKNYQTKIKLELFKSTGDIHTIWSRNKIWRLRGSFIENYPKISD